MMQRLLAGAAALGAMLAASGAIVVALSFALYAVLKDRITPAGASACVALALAVLAGIGVLLTQAKARGPKPKHRDDHAGGGSALDRFVDFARERPIAAAAAAIGAGLVALRSPGLAGTLATLALGGGGGGGGGKNRRGKSK